MSQIKSPLCSVDDKIKLFYDNNNIINKLKVNYNKYIKYNDIIFKFNDTNKILKGNKCVLANVSDYFDKLFTHDTNNINNGVQSITIEEIKFEIFEYILLLCYNIDYIDIYEYNNINIMSQYNNCIFTENNLYKLIISFDFMLLDSMFTTHLHIYCDISTNINNLCKLRLYTDNKHVISKITYLLSGKNNIIIDYEILDIDDIKYMIDNIGIKLILDKLNISIFMKYSSLITYIPTNLIILHFHKLSKIYDTSILFDNIIKYDNPKCMIINNKYIFGHSIFKYLDDIYSMNIPLLKNMNIYSIIDTNITKLHNIKTIFFDNKLTSTLLIEPHYFITTKNIRGIEMTNNKVFNYNNLLNLYYIPTNIILHDYHY
uniref:BTB/POZ domain protein n=1 Tax=Pithovirus LCPAC102 TaxID=2506587 RepID=A0A481Z300_9VIRU|nr:MAG: BTB/POZ domain protein [Pithovirus LCPAC102]